MSDSRLPSSFDGDSEFYEENRWQKFSRRLKEEPLIPLGCALTCYAFYGATKSIRAGDSTTAQVMFRRRLYAQTFTLAVMVAGSWYYKADRTRRKEFDGLVAEKKAKEKNEAWIRELEARDQDDKEWRVKMNAAASGKKAVTGRVVTEDAALEKGWADKVAADAEEGAREGRQEGPVVKAVKELKGLAKESTEAIKERVGPPNDAEEVKKES